MTDEECTYGYYRYLNETNFARNGYVFQGWSTTKDGIVEYVNKESVKNLSAQLDHVVTLYAVWNALIGIENDNEAVVTGNDSDGYVIRPSKGKTDIVARIPAGFDASKVVLEVGTQVETVLPNGATIKIVKGVNDITGFLNLPAADGSGLVDLTKAEVKEAIRKEPLDPSKGADIKLVTSNPQITTAPTRAGLTYTLREGATLQTMSDGASKLGDGKAWVPTITVKGGNSGFYSIRVSK